MKASIIIPAYNAEGFIERAIRSVSDHTLLDYEIVVVDDGSRDGTLSLLNRLADEIPQLKVYSKENAGPAAARNFGMEKAKGDYILFCDSDDSFTPGAIDEVVGLCDKKGSDVLIFGYLLTQEGDSVPYCYPPCAIVSQEDWQAHLAGLYKANMLNQVWGKVFSARLLREGGVSFPSALWGEDRLFFFKALEGACRVDVTDGCYYDYIQQKNSLISRFIAEKCRLCEEIHLMVREFARSRGALTEEAKKVYSYMYAKSLLSAFATLFSPSCHLSHREKRAYVRDALHQKSLDEVGEFPAGCGKSFCILAGLIKSKNVTLNLWAAWGVRLVSKISPALLRRAKHAYNNEKGECK